MKKNIKYYPSRDENSFHFDHVHIKPAQQVPLHQQATWELSYIITGSGARIIGDVVENFSKGEVILIPPHIPHCWSFDENDVDAEGKIENITIVIENSFWNASGALFPSLMPLVGEIKSNENAVSFGGSILTQIRELMCAMIAQDPVERLSSFIKLLTLISHGRKMQVVGRPVVENRKDKKLQEIYLYVLNNYQRNLTLEEIAKAVGMQRSSFCTFFKKMTGKTFFTYLLAFRLESACQMLVKTNQTVAEICLSSGFNDVPYFNRVFKKLKKTTPLGYRLQFQQDGIAGEM